MRVLKMYFLINLFFYFTLKLRETTEKGGRQGSCLKTDLNNEIEVKSTIAVGSNRSI